MAIEEKADALYDYTKECLEMLKKEKIYVRYFNKPRIDNYLRISI